MYCLFAYWPFCYIGNTVHPMAELGGLFVEASAIRCDRTIIYSLDGSLVTIIINIIWQPSLCCLAVTILPSTVTHAKLPSFQLT